MGVAMRTATAILAEGFRGLWQARLLNQPDGRPLYGYRFTDLEYEHMRGLLAACGRQFLSDGPGAALFVAYTAEWFRRTREGGHWDWIRPLSSLGVRYHHTGRSSDVAYGAVRGAVERGLRLLMRSEEQTSDLQSLMRISYAVFCLKKKKST